ncbi:MAG: DNA mismatch repair endonuclease MutL [Gammaproteobacteria bacterium]|nr:DNA mismatch repair endonuclease MutL [Gammaproteobacteria bacterium]
MNLRAIRPLPEAVINQIAAGEVVERPASVVKELVENALDAGAGSIDVEIDDGGIARIQVRDDGGGIPCDELALALTRHCTSKITSADDLPLLVTLGFRGEALAAIAAVADTDLVSRGDGAVHGWRVVAGPQRLPGLPEPVPHPRGTTVIVRDLFARVPARRRFLKRAQTEALHVQNLLRRIAFCTPAVAFTLTIDGVRSLRLPAARDASSAERRQRALFGAEFASGARYVDRVFGDTRVAGWVGGPALAHAQADLQMFAVNGRVVRDRQLLHGVRTAFDARLPAGRHACFALQIEMPPEAVDVNVHPGKIEVRFRDLRAVHDSVHAAVREALAVPTQYALPGTETTATATARDGPRTPLRAAAPAPAGPSDIAPRRLPRASPSQRVLAVVAARYAIVAASGTDEGVSVIDLGALVAATLCRRLAADAPTRPLLIPLRLECPDARHAGRIATLLATLGIDTSSLGERVLAMRTLPLAVPPLAAERFGPALVARFAARDGAAPAFVLAGAVAESLQVPTADERISWLERLRATAREAGIDDTAHVRRLDDACLQRIFLGPA